MTIRLAQPKDIPALLGLLEQILSVHHHVRPDIFKGSGGKYSKEELKQLMAQEQTPIFVYENADGQILGHLFVTIKEGSGNPVLHPIKTLFIEDLCVDQATRGQKNRRSTLSVCPSLCQGNRLLQPDS